MTPEMFQGWAASLSNGETVFEAPPVQGEMSTWQKLLKRLRDDNNLEMTQLRLQRSKRTIVGCHKADGYFQACEIHAAVIQGTSELFYGVGSVIGDQVFINWMNAQGDTRQDVRSLKEVLIHTTLA